LAFEENRPCFARPIFAVLNFYPPPFTFVNHIETIP
jgi:hypothetical protein